MGCDIDRIYILAQIEERKAAKALEKLRERQEEEQAEARAEAEQAALRAAFQNEQVCRPSTRVMIDRTMTSINDTQSSSIWSSTRPVARLSHIHR